MFIDNERIISLAPKESQAIFLFGSYARGDETPQSDVDILAVVNSAFVSTADLPPGLCLYTFRQLERMAQRGSLFVLHLIKEAIAVFDPLGLLRILANKYRRLTFSKILEDVNWSAKLLTTDPTTYKIRKYKYNRLSINITRTISFAKSDEAGSLSFSMNKVASQLDLEWLASLPRPEKMEWSNYLEVLGNLRLLAECDFHNPYGTTEALIVNAWEHSAMCVGLGLRLLSSEVALVYEDADLRWLIDAP